MLVSSERSTFEREFLHVDNGETISKVISWAAGALSVLIDLETMRGRRRPRQSSLVKVLPRPRSFSIVC